MKKRSLLAAFCGATAFFSADAQQVMPTKSSVETHINSAPVPFSSLVIQGKKQTISEWFNFMDASGSVIDYTTYNNNSMFPDSTVQQSYGLAGGGTTLGYVARHNVGQVFDPKSFFFPTILNEHNPYTVDSIAIGYRYMHNMPGTTDTIEVQVFTGSGITQTTLIDANGNEIGKTAIIGYNRTIGNGLNAVQTIRFTLDENDTTWASFTTRGIALNSPISIARPIKNANGVFVGGLIAVAYRFIPGYEYSLGDTLQHNYDPAPVKKLNHFQPLIGADLAKTPDDSYNNGLSVRSFQKYSTNTSDSWRNSFIPGDAWNDYTEQVYIGFKVASPNVSVKKVNANGLGLGDAYPNPAAGSAVNIDYSLVNATDVTIEIYDMLGNKVQTVVNAPTEAGNYTATADISGLPSGIYVYTLKAGDYAVSKKLTVVK